MADTKELKVFHRPTMLATERIRTELEKFNISFNEEDKRNTLLRLYEEHLLPFKGDFQHLRAMADSTQNIAAASLKVAHTTNAAKANEVPDFIKRLKPEELKQGLKDLGETAGPITDTTRPFVEKKYYKLLAARKDLDTESDEEPTVPPSPEIAKKSARERKATPPRQKVIKKQADVGPIFSDDDTPDLTNSVRRRALRQSASDARRKQPVPVFSEDESVAPASDSQRTPRHNNAKLGTSRAQSDSAQVARSDATKLETEIAAPSAAAFVCRLLVLLALAGLLIWLWQNAEYSAASGRAIGHDSKSVLD